MGPQKVYCMPFGLSRILTGMELYLGLQVSSLSWLFHHLRTHSTCLERREKTGKNSDAAVGYLVSQKSNKSEECKLPNFIGCLECTTSTPGFQQSNNLITSFHSRSYTKQMVSPSLKLLEG